MLIDFSFKNYKSYNNLQNFTMRRDNRIKIEKDSILLDCLPKEGVSRTAVFYGPNASGKTNILDALVALCTTVVSRREADIPTFYNNGDQTDFYISYYFTKKYNYYLSVKGGDIIYEKLDVYNSQKPTTIYSYSLDSGFVSNNIKDDEENKAVRYNFKNNRKKPILYHLRNSKNDSIKNAYHFFRDGITINDATAASEEYIDRKYNNMATRNDRLIDIFSSMISSADFGINRIEQAEDLNSFSKEQKMVVFDAIIRIDELGDKKFTKKDKARMKKEFESSMTEKNIRFVHNSGNNTVDLKTADESNGTIAASNVFLDLIDVIKNGKVYIVDELDCSLHPSITSEIVKIFNSPETNPRNAQLIFTTHDLSLLDSSIHDEDLFDRDQVWLTDKKNTGESEAYPLTAISDVPRIDDNLYKNYILGRYGATPKTSIYYEFQKLWREEP